jgi:hypothetical protein
LSRRSNRYSGWDPTGLEAVHGRRDGRAYTCRACNRTGLETANGDTPVGWYHLKISGHFDEHDVRPGYYCSAECLAVATLRTYGFTDRQVREWLSS